MILSIGKMNKVKGELKLPGDKSISHRSIMFASMAPGESTIKNCLSSQDLYSTINCFRALGCDIEVASEIIKVTGKGFRKFQKPSTPLDCGNSGTTTRLIAGILAAQNFETKLVGDASLSERPMRRIVDPLELMGARIVTGVKGTLPVTIYPVETLKAIEYDLPVASAQVKSAVLLAGLFQDEKTCVIEKVPTRNHTETMLQLSVDKFDGFDKIYSSKNNYPEPHNYLIPSDISSAAFFIVLGLLLKDSEIIINNVLLNPSRTGIIDVLKSMGGYIEIIDKKVSSGEEYGNLLVRSSKLVNTEIDKHLIPNIIDEIPILSAAGLLAEGSFRVNNAEELRHKESDRIKALCTNYRKLGIEVDESSDGFSLKGEVKNPDILIESYGDHRIAMTFAILGSILEPGLQINNFECAAVSNPDFINQLKSIAV